MKKKTILTTPPPYGGGGWGVRLLLLFLLTSCASPTIKVALLTGSQSSELTALGNLLQSEENISYTYLPIDDLVELSDYDVVWYHRPDTLPFTEREKRMGAVLTNYVSAGGKLLLSMEAVRLLNEWNIEPEPIEATTFNAQDNGFGRKVGFHAYREHPLFDKMFGGAYTWHGKEDNRCRVLGFFGDKWPRAKTAKVIGTLWEYIYYHPKDKVLWETRVGNGKILAVGGFLYYDKENFHREILNCFTRNCLDYLAGKPMESKAFYWEDRPTEVVAEELPVGKVPLVAPADWYIPATNQAMRWKATRTGIDLPSKRTMLVAGEKGGIEEVWTHPFMSLRDYRVWLDVAGRDTLVALDSYDAIVELRANAIIRTYQGDGFTLKEVLTSQVDKPVIVAHYEWDGAAIRRIVTDYKSNLRFMWPYDEYALGSVFYNWCAEANAFVIRDVKKEFVSLVGANLPGEPLLAGRFEGFTYPGKQPQGVVTEKLQVASSVAYDVAGRQALDLFMVAGNEGVEKAVAEYTAAMQAPQEVFDTSADYYAGYLDRHLSVLTPDPVFNEGLRWATLSSAQFIAETPGVGTSLMAGYASSRRGWGGAHKVSGRPGYAWYFGRDAVWSAFAFAGLGDFTTVREVLETLIRYQQIDGKIYHELTTSGSVHFDASDATPLFVNLMARYLRASGDLDFVKKNMPAVIKAMDYCYSTDTNDDHLIEITNVGHGWLEGGELYGSQTEFYLAGLWNAALNDAAYMAAMTGDAASEAKYTAEAKVVNEIINRDFWNEKGYFNYGKREDGSFTDECIVLTTVPVYMGVTDADRSLRMVKDFASGRYSADWGVRMIDDTHSVFNPSAYHFGSVWPLFTGWTALAEYEVGRYNQGFSHLMSSLLNYRGETSRGRVPEVINGLVFKSSGVTTHQCWSETMVLQPVIEGMLGFVPDAPHKQMTLAPRLPFHWNTLQVRNLRIGGTSVAFDMKKEKGRTVYTFTADSPLTVHFRPAFAPGTQVDRVLVNGKETEYACTDNGEYMNAAVEIPLDKTVQVEITYREGMSALPVYRLAGHGEMSKGIHVLSQQWTDAGLEVVVEGRPGSGASLELYLPEGCKGIEGAKQISAKPGGVCVVEIAFPHASQSYVTGTIKVLK